MPEIIPFLQSPQPDRRDKVHSHITVSQGTISQGRRS